jgi:hypothetical protein
MIGAELERHFCLDHHSLMVWRPGVNAVSLPVHCNKYLAAAARDESGRNVALREIPH